jgi:hypothetical protein
MRPILSKGAESIAGKAIDLKRVGGHAVAGGTGQMSDIISHLAIMDRMPSEAAQIQISCSYPIAGQRRAGTSLLRFTSGLGPLRSAGRLKNFSHSN